MHVLFKTFHNEWNKSLRCIVVTHLAEWQQKELLRADHLLEIL